MPGPERPDEPLVDVGIPVYERPRYIPEAIESVITQTFSSWRLTISDDGDGGGAVAQAVKPYLADPRIRYLSTGKRLGEGGNWSRIVELSNAPYVAILHDDDRWHRDFLARRVDFLDQHPKCGLVFSRTREIDSEGRFIRLSRCSFTEGVTVPEDSLPRLIRGNEIGNPPSVVVRRSAYEAVGRAFRNDLPYPDYEMWFRIAVAFPIGFLAVADADYRVHVESTSAQIGHDTRHFLRLQDHLVEIVERERPDVLSWRQRRRPRSDILLAAGLDALQEGGLRRSSALVAEALRTYPPVIFDFRIPVWLLALAAGSPARRALARVRSAANRRGIRPRVKPARR